MTNNSKYTRCPQCKTAFKVSDKMLSMAHGKVRCGACLEVFLATEHILQPRASLQSTNLNSSTTATDSAPRSSETASSEIGATEDSSAEGDSFAAAENLTNTDTQSITSARPNDVTLTDWKLPETEEAQSLLDFEQESKSAEIDDIGGEKDSAGHEVTLDEERLILPDENNDLPVEEVVNDSPQNISGNVEAKIDDAVAKIDALEDSLVEEEIALDQLPEEDFVDDPQISDESLDDDSWSDEPDDERFAHEGFEDDGFEGQLFDEELDTEEDYDSQFDESLDSDRMALADSDELGMLADNLSEQIYDSNTEPDPLEEFEGRVEKKKTSLRTIMIGVTALGVFSYLAANFWSSRQALAYDDTWGGLTQTVCGLLPCDIQPQKDVRKISLQQRIVTPSENQDNFLDIKIILKNEADFAQPYPKITIDFTNENLDVVAVKSFTVEEYFPEKQGQMMPSQVEVHIAWTIEQPHPDGLGFRFSFN